MQVSLTTAGIQFPNIMNPTVPVCSMERITAVARGRVQGVGYRAFVAGCARETGVHGRVRNLPDGNVEIVAESSPAALADFIRLAHAPGSRMIQVEEIAVVHGPATGEFHGFWVDW
jgi:acylphosphatase